MRIVSYLPTLEARGGVELHLLQELRALAERGHRIYLFHEVTGNLEPEFREFCELVSAGPSARYSEEPWRDAPRLLAHGLAASRVHPDLVYVNSFNELAWAAVISARARAPIVCRLHELQRVRHISVAVLGSRVSRFVVSSRFMRRAWSSHGIDGARIEVIGSGFSPTAYPPGDESDRERSRQSLGLRPDAYVVLYMGRLIPEKGVDVLLGAWHRLDLGSEEARLLIVGLPPVSDPHVEALQLGAPPETAWLPLRSDVIGVLHAADVLVLPSRWDEPFGRVVLEAMATGRPAVAAAVGGIPEILDGEFARMLFPRDDAGALADRLRALRNWRRDDPGLATRCVEHVARRFTLEAAVDRLEAVFETVVRRR
jgi:glycosyltransferase involved in cell wall biosynthesis